MRHFSPLLLAIPVILLSRRLWAGDEVKVPYWGWRTPCVSEWTDERIVLGGIEASQVDDLCVWSIDKAEIVWCAEANHFAEYRKASRKSFVSTPFGKLHPEWKQRFPFQNAPPREIGEGETICVSVSYQYSFFIGIAGESGEFYYRKSKGKYTQLFVVDGKIEQYDREVSLHLMGAAVNDLKDNRYQPPNPATPATPIAQVGTESSATRDAGTDGPPTEPVGASPTTPAVAPP